MANTVGLDLMVPQAQGHKIMLVSLVMCLRWGTDTTEVEMGSVIRRIWEGSKIKARRAEFNHILKQGSANIFCKGPDGLCSFCYNDFISAIVAQKQSGNI